MVKHPIVDANKGLCAHCRKMAAKVARAQLHIKKLAEEKGDALAMAKFYRERLAEIDKLARVL